MDKSILLLLAAFLIVLLQNFGYNVYIVFSINEVQIMNLDKNELDFAVFCVESIAEHLNINGADVYSLLTADSDILDSYIVPNYESLHTQGKEYIVNDIVDYMKKEGLIK